MGLGTFLSIAIATATILKETLEKDD